MSPSSGSGRASGRSSWCGSCWTTRSTGRRTRTCSSGWLEWDPLAQEAALGIGAVFAELPAGISFDEARANVQIDIDELHAEAGL